MEPTEAFTLTQVALYIGSKLLDGSLETLGSELSKGAISWVKTLFFNEDDTPKPVLEDLKNDPDDEDNKIEVRTVLSKAVKKDPTTEQWVQEIHALLQKQASAGDTSAVSIINSKNVATGTIHAGGNIHIGDSNTQS